MANSVTAETQKLQCQCPVHQQLVTMSGINNQVNDVVYYVQNLHIPVCRLCGTNQYSGQCILIEDYYQQIQTQIQTQEQKIKELINQTSTLINQYKQIQSLDKLTIDQNINQITVLKQQLIEVINYKFTLIESNLRQQLTQQKEWNQRQAEFLTNIFNEAINSFISLEKHLQNRDQSVFITEYDKLNTEYQQKLNDLLSDLEIRESVKQLKQVKLNGIKTAQDAIQSISINTNQQLSSSQLGGSSSYQNKVQIVQKGGLQCNNCGNIIIPYAQQITDVAEKQKGNLYGIKPEDVNQESLILDQTSGTPGSRHILCSNCKKEIGRYSEQDAEEKKFTPGYLFLSINCLK